MTARLPGLRSLLLVDPGSLDGLDLALAASPDGLVLDLTAAAALPDVVALFAHARRLAPRLRLLIRVGAIRSDRIEAALDAGLPARPHAVLADSRDGADVQHLGVKLGVREARLGLAHGATGIVARAGASAAGLLALASFAAAGPRLVALAWDAAALETDVGSAPATFDGPAGEPAASAMARTLLLLGAGAAGISAFDTITAQTGDAFARDCSRLRRLGFAGKIARDPDQIAAINAAFGPHPP